MKMRNEKINIFLKKKQNTLKSRKRKSVLPHFFKPWLIIQYSIAFIYEGNLKIINMLLQKPDGVPAISCRFEDLPISSSPYENNIWKNVEDFTLKQLLLFEIGPLEVCEKFVYKHSETLEYVEN